MYLPNRTDRCNRHAWGRLYTSKHRASVHVLNETVLPFFEAHEARVYTTIPSDNGREFCGRLTHHPYELFLQLGGD